MSKIKLTKTVTIAGVVCKAGAEKTVSADTAKWLIDKNAAKEVKHDRGNRKAQTKADNKGG